MHNKIDRLALLKMYNLKFFRMKKLLMLCLAMMAMGSQAQVTAERCTKADYDPCISWFYCECSPITLAKLSPADSMRIDSVLRHVYVPVEEHFSYELWWNKLVYQNNRTQDYIVEFGARYKESGEPLFSAMTAFIDTSFRPLGAIVGEGFVWDCCARRVATLESKHDVIHLYRWNHDKGAKSLPEEVGVFAPKDIVPEGYYWGLWDDALYVEGHELVDGRQGDVVYLRVSSEQQPFHTLTDDTLFSIAQNGKQFYITGKDVTEIDRDHYYLTEEKFQQLDSIRDNMEHPVVLTEKISGVWNPVWVQHSWDSFLMTGERKLHPIFSKEYPHLNGKIVFRDDKGRGCFHIMKF